MWISVQHSCSKLKCDLFLFYDFQSFIYETKVTDVNEIYKTYATIKNFSMAVYTSFYTIGCIYAETNKCFGLLKTTGAIWVINVKTGSPEK